MSERRRPGRTRTYLGGTITFNHGQQSLNCLVRNLSGEGVRFDFSDAVMLPEEVDLAIPLRGESRRVRILWRRDDSVGAAFLPPRADGNVVPFTPRPRAG